MNQYAGEKMTTGAQAEVWADDYIKVHLSTMPTYDAASAAARANPTSAAAAATEATVFQGTMLRSTLLNAYGWWTVGTYALYAGIGLAIAALVVLGTFVFELTRWRADARATRPATVPETALGSAGSVPALGSGPDDQARKLTTPRRDGPPVSDRRAVLICSREGARHRAPEGDPARLGAAGPPVQAAGLK